MLHFIRKEVSLNPRKAETWSASVVPHQAGSPPRFMGDRKIVVDSCIN